MAYLQEINTEEIRQLRCRVAELAGALNQILGDRDKRIVGLERRLSDETQQRERFEEEVECAHKWLDERGVPRVDTGGEVFSLVGRMMRLSDKP